MATCSRMSELLNSNLNLNEAFSGLVITIWPVFSDVNQIKHNSIPGEDSLSSAIINCQFYYHNHKSEQWHQQFFHLL